MSNQAVRILAVAFLIAVIALSAYLGDPTPIADMGPQAATEQNR